MVPVCGQMGRCGHWLAGQDSSITLSQVSRHVRLSIVSGQQLPLQGARPLLKGTSRTVRYSHQQVPQGSDLKLLPAEYFGLFSALCCPPLYFFFLTLKLQRILHGEFSYFLPYVFVFLIVPLVSFFLLYTSFHFNLSIPQYLEFTWQDETDVWDAAHQGEP